MVAKQGYGTLHLAQFSADSDIESLDSKSEKGQYFTQTRSLSLLLLAVIFSCVCVLIHGND